MTNRTKLINRRYRLERRLTLTDSTETWLGFDNVLHRAVAITLPRQELLRNLPFLEEFLQRSRIATALHHRGIVAAFDSGEDGDTPYLITEYIGGELLANIIRAEAPFDADDVSILVEQVAGALDYAHQRGFVHGALTGSDVIVDSQGVAKVLGLGIPSGSLNTIDSMGPRVPITFDDDVRAIAALAFEMLTGEEPEATEAGSEVEAYAIDPDVPRNASDIVAIGLGAGPVRFSSAGTFARSLSDWRTFDPSVYYVSAPAPRVTSDGIPAPKTSMAIGLPAFEADAWFDDELPPVSETTPGRGRSNQGVQLALVAALLLALLAGVLVWRGSDAAAEPTVLPSQIEALAGLGGF